MTQLIDVGHFLHQNITRNADITTIESFLKNQNIDEDEHFYNRNMVSTAALALKCERFDIYELLISYKISLGPHEHIRELIYASKRQKVAEIHRKNVKCSSPQHLVILYSKSYLSHDASAIDRPIYADKISKAFEDLNILKLVEPILKVISIDPKLTIVFDFNRESVSSFDPRKAKEVLGTTYFEEHDIYIGAKGLLVEEKNYCQALGVMAHEFCHFAMYFVYNNSCKPYLHENLEKIDKFKAIVEQTATKKDSEEIIKGAYISSEVQHEELIVRVPHLAALYKDENEKFEAASKEFNELFQFYKENTLVDLQREYPLMEAKQELIDLYTSSHSLQKAVIELSTEGMNIDLKADNNILFISSNCPQLTMSAITQKFKDNIEYGSLIIVNPRILQDAKFFSAALKAMSLATKPKLIIDCADRRIDEVKQIIDKFKENQVDQRIVFVSDETIGSIIDSSIKIKHIWSHLTTELQQKILQNKISFQNNEIQLSDLMTDLSAIDAIPFKDFLNDEIISIAKNESYERIANFIDRKFMSLNSRKFDLENHDIEHDFNEIFDFAVKSRTILLSDEPGMGKSTSFKVIQAKLIEDHPMRWIVFMDLKKHFNAFQVNSENLINLRNHEKFEDEYRKKITKFLCEILKINGFEAQIFAHLFNDNRVIVLMDGLDEICPNLKNPVFGFAHAFQENSSNQLWISTRPHLVNDIKEILDPITLKLKPFSIEDRKEFFEKAFMARDKEDQYIEQKIEEVEEFLKKLRGSIRDNDSVSNPLLFKMIAECIDELHSIELSNANLYSIYEQFTDKMIDRCLEKGLEAMTIRKSVGNSKMVKFYHKIAFRTCFNNEDMRDLVEQTITLGFQNASSFSLDDIVRVGLLFSDDSGDFQFIHRSFDEFYVAKYFHEMIFLGEYLPENLLKLIVELLMAVLKQEEYKMIKTLLDNALDSFEASESFQKVNSMFSNISMEINYEILEQLTEDGHLNLIKIFLTHFHSNPRELLLTQNERGNIIMIAAEYQSNEFIELFLGVLEKFLDSDQLRKLLLHRDEFKRNVFRRAALNRDPEVFSFVIKRVLVLTDRDFVSNLLMQSDSNIIMNSLRRHSIALIERFFAIIGEFLDSDQLRRLLLQQDKERNVIRFAATNRDPEVLNFAIKKVLELTDRNFTSNLLMQRDEYGQNLIMKSVRLRSLAVIESFFAIFGKLLHSDKLRQLLLERDRYEKNLFQSAAQNIDPEVLIFVLKKVKELTDRDSVANLLIQMDEDGRNAIMKSFWRRSLAVNESFFATIEEIFCSKYSKQIKRILLERDKDGRNVFHFTADNEDPEVLNFVLKKMTELTDCDFAANLLMQKDKSGQNAITKSVGLRSLAINESFFATIEKILDSSEIRKMLLERDEDGQNISYFAAENDDPEVLKFVMKKVNELAGYDFTPNLLMQSD